MSAVLIAAVLALADARASCVSVQLDLYRSGTHSALITMTQPIDFEGAQVTYTDGNRPVAIDEVTPLGDDAAWLRFAHPLPKAGRICFDLGPGVSDSCSSIRTADPSWFATAPDLSIARQWSSYAGQEYLLLLLPRKKPGFLRLETSDRTWTLTHTVPFWSVLLAPDPERIDWCRGSYMVHDPDAPLVVTPGHLDPTVPEIVWGDPVTLPPIPEDPDTGCVHAPPHGALPAWLGLGLLLGRRGRRSAHVTTPETADP